MEDLSVLRVLAQLAPAIILLALAWRVRATVARFRAAGVTVPERAQSLADLGVRPGGAVRLLRRHGVLVDVGTHRYYFDEVAYERWRRRRRTILAVALSALAVLAIVLLATRQ